MEDHPEFETVMQSIEDRFWDNNKELKQKLSEKGLLQSLLFLFSILRLNI